jgi:hypothetical protein
MDARKDMERSPYIRGDMQMNRRLTPDQRVGLNVTGLLLVALGVILGVISYRQFGIPHWPLPSDELPWTLGAALSAIVGLGCLYRGTDVIT